MSLSFTTTAMCRPDIWLRTLKSFSANLQDIDLKSHTLFLNIDPLPETAVSIRDRMVEVAQSFFGRVVFRIPDEAGFTAAVKWGWESVDTDYVFHLEDDWILIRKISVSDMLARLQPPAVIQVVIRAYGARYNKMVLSPSIIKVDVARLCASKFILTKNPEVQLRIEEVKGRSIAVVPRRGIAVKDIGRAWKATNKIRQPFVKSKFNRWFTEEEKLEINKRKAKNRKASKQQEQKD